MKEVSLKYKVIYADPPWQYKDNQISGGTAYLGAAARYPTMPLEDIMNLPVSDIADKDSALFLGATSPLLPDALRVMYAWGFKYKTVAFVWSKVSNRGNLLWNSGRWTMGNTEICLLGVRGKPKRVSKSVKQLIVAERTIHSRKPEEARKRIVDLMGDVPRVELFARQSPPGWDVWGNEVDSTVYLN